MVWVRVGVAAAKAASSGSKLHKSIFEGVPSQDCLKYHKSMVCKSSELRYASKRQ